MRLRPLTLDDNLRFEHYARRTATKLSYYAFAPLYVWRNQFQFYWAVVDDLLCVFARQGDDYFMPIMPMGGAAEERTIRQVVEFMLEANRAKQIARIENAPAGRLPFFQKLGFRTIVKDTEYLYETDKLIQLRGNRYKSKRSACNAFVRAHPGVQLKPYRKERLADCLALYDVWMADRRTHCDDEIYRGMLEDSRSAHRVGLMHSEALGLIGRTVVIDGELKGYTFGYPLNSEVFCILFEVPA